MNTPVSFELAKLLKEKGFNSPVNKVYLLQVDYTVFNKTGSNKIVTFLNGDKWECANESFDWNGKISQVMGNEYFSAPTIADVLMWIYDNYQIWIGCREFENGSGKTLFIANGRYVPTKKVKGFEHDPIPYMPKDNPTEAYEAAITHVVNNLI